MLAPGLWMPGASMALLAARLARAGYQPRLFSYRGRSPLEANVERLAHFAPRQAAHYVGYSLGGLVMLETLTRHPGIAVRSVVLLGSPVRGCLAGRRFGRHRTGRWMLGASCELWNEREARWSRPEPLGVVAGTLPLAFGRAFGRLPGENDGVVCVSETTVEGMTARVLVRQGHSLLGMSGRVGRLTERFLATGSFA